ncbi:MAG: TPM domain-containing protein, partial [Thermoanaerobaculia bacterium]
CELSAHSTRNIEHSTLNIQHSTFLVLIRTVAVVTLLVTATAAAALDCPPPPTRHYSDKAALLDTAQAEALDGKLADFEQSSGAQFIIYILPSIEGDAIERFTVDCAQKWGVGQKKYNNGLVLFVFVKEKKVRIEVGYGLEGTITDAISSRVIRESIAPHFRQGDWAGGLNAAADAIMAKIRGEEAPVQPLQQRGSGQQQRGGNAFGSIAPVIIFFVFLFFILPMLRRRGGGCGGCWPLFFLGGGGTTLGGGGWGGGGGGGWGGGGGGGFSGGGGSFGGGGATGGW